MFDLDYCMRTTCGNDGHPQHATLSIPCLSTACHMARTSNVSILIERSSFTTPALNQNPHTHRLSAKREERRSVWRWCPFAVYLLHVCCFRSYLRRVEESDSAFPFPPALFSPYEGLNQQILFIGPEYPSLFEPDYRQCIKLDTGCRGLETASSCCRSRNNLHTLLGDPAAGPPHPNRSRNGALGLPRTHQERTMHILAGKDLVARSKLQMLPETMSARWSEEI